MKRLTAIFFALLLMFGAATTTSAASRDSKNNSRVEKFVQGLAHDYSSHVEYSYISMNMLRSLFSMMFGEDDKEMAKIMKRLKYIRKYSSSDSEGYKKLKIPASGLAIPDEDISTLQLSIDVK